ncbi:aKG-HExxH-type peptide beta-hydroxylase [Saccharothrix sp. NRRL B-16348]|uniref:aKG-HExxH-type peptide beta-hydroxylase n=1 Tax=Saccharothrix sp. NRRL B-16348 TaxID=1415542 RepID=UPI0006AD8EBD|nr:HEXXH motif-containing putative peptide modification protein [Saccharothrix sp. NRRL B-16348]
MTRGDHEVAGWNSTHGISLPNHGMSLTELDALASAQPDGGVTALLHRVERTRRLLALRLVLHHARDHPAPGNPLPSVDEAWELLVAAERARPEAVADLLSLPQVGVWSAHVLRRLRDKASDTAPAWFHVGQLHLLAAAAGLSAELRFTMAIPLRDGIAVLPGWGTARVPETTGWGHGTLVADASGLTVKTGSGAAHPVEWQPIRILEGDVDSTAPRIHLDDTGPYRGLAIPERPDPLSDSSAARWNALFADAWAILKRDHPHRARELSTGLSVITPRPAAYRFRPHSGSVGDGYGAAIISEPHDAVQLAVTMVHEYQHSKLNAIGHLVALTRVDPATTCYAPWRDDARPVSGLYQGVNAFLAVAEFWWRQRGRVSGPDAALAHFEFALVRVQVTEALDALRRHPSLTEPGRRFAARLAERLATLTESAVPAELLTAAETATLDHRAAWRVTHLRPARAHVLECVERRRAGEPAPTSGPSPVVVADAAPPRLDAKAILTRVLLSDRAAFDAMRSDASDDLPKIATDLTEADFALVAGHHDRAHALYAAELAEGSNRAGAWSGFGLAVRALSPGPASRALLERPDLVRAVRNELALTDEAPDVERLAAWLGADL